MFDIFWEVLSLATFIILSLQWSVAYYLEQEQIKSQRKAQKVQKRDSISSEIVFPIDTEISDLQPDQSLNKEPLDKERSIDLNLLQINQQEMRMKKQQMIGHDHDELDDDYWLQQQQRQRQRQTINRLSDIREVTESREETEGNMQNEEGWRGSLELQNFLKQELEGHDENQISIFRKSQINEQIQKLQELKLKIKIKDRESLNNTQRSAEGIITFRKKSDNNQGNDNRNNLEIQIMEILEKDVKMREKIFKKLERQQLKKDDYNKNYRSEEIESSEEGNDDCDDERKCDKIMKLTTVEEKLLQISEKEKQIKWLKEKLAMKENKILGIREQTEKQWKLLINQKQKSFEEQCEKMKRQLQQEICQNNETAKSRIEQMSKKSEEKDEQIQKIHQKLKLTEGQLQKLQQQFKRIELKKGQVNQTKIQEEKVSCVAGGVMEQKEMIPEFEEEQNKQWKREEKNKVKEMMETIEDQKKKIEQQRDDYQAQIEQKIQKNQKLSLKLEESSKKNRQNVEEKEKMKENLISMEKQLQELKQIKKQEVIMMNQGNQTEEKEQKDILSQQQAKMQPLTTTAEQITQTSLFFPKIQIADKNEQKMQEYENKIQQMQAVIQSQNKQICLKSKQLTKMQFLNEQNIMMRRKYSEVRARMQKINKDKRQERGASIRAIRSHNASSQKSMDNNKKTITLGKKLSQFSSQQNSQTAVTTTTATTRKRTSTIQYYKFLSECQFLQLEDRQFIYKCLNDIMKTILKSEKLYSSVKNQSQNPHDFMKDRGHILLLILLQNKKVLGAYSHQPFSDEKLSKQIEEKKLTNIAFIFDVSKKRIFRNSQGKHSITYNPNKLIWGFNEILINNKEPNVLYSNLFNEDKGIFCDGSYSIKQFLESELRWARMEEFQIFTVIEM